MVVSVEAVGQSVLMVGCLAAVGVMKLIRLEVSVSPDLRLRLLLLLSSQQLSLLLVPLSHCHARHQVHNVLRAELACVIGAQDVYLCVCVDD